MAQSQSKRSADREAWRKEMASIRETVGSVGIAIIGAFVLRAFLLEAFVIPTGSMAPRLMGEHYDLVCPHCGWDFDRGFPTHDGQTKLARGEKDNAVEFTYCPNCRLEYPKDKRYGAYVNGGDRVLVAKCLYNFRDPEPWDVVVFRNPQNNRENYIKRLVGLPGETIEIVRGDVWVKPADSNEWHIRRKPNGTQRAMWHVVHDNDYPIADRPGWAPPAGADSPWTTTGDHGRRLNYAGGVERADLEFQAREHSFSPFYGYNAPRANFGTNFDPRLDICTDLALSAVFTPQADDSRVGIVFDVLDQRLAAEVWADGTVRLWRQAAERAPITAGQTIWLGQGHWDLWQEGKVAPLTIGRSVPIAVWNADYRLTLWVSGRAVLQSDDEKQYPADYHALKQRIAPDALRRTPLPKTAVRIAAGGGAGMLQHVKLERDVYYTGANRRRPTGVAGEYARGLNEYKYNTSNWEDRPGWGVEGNPITLHKYDDNPDMDSFFMLGDNSPASLDSRAWSQVAPTLKGVRGGQREYQMGTVPRYNLIGKAMFVYWPAGFRAAPLPSLPVIPNVGRMRLVR
ncbi:MAG: signal peptidase I [Planctomycetota bacterium]|jgi:signal peptidase I